MGWTGAVFSAINSPLPLMLVPIGIADGIHVIHHYLHTVAKQPDRTNEESVFDTMQGMFTAVVMTCMGFVIAVAAATLALSLHSVRGVLLPLLVVLTSIVWTMGLMGWTGPRWRRTPAPIFCMRSRGGLAERWHRDRSRT